MKETSDKTQGADALKETISVLQEKVLQYERLLGLREVNKEYKDRLFKAIFGNPDNRQWTLDLYNAVNGTDYTDPDEIQFNTIGDFLYLKMRNDASFIIRFEMNLWEAQSSYNPNMPLRFLRYAARLYEKYIATTDYYEYGTVLQQIPRPVCVCFYNGTKNIDESQILKLSDAYEGEGDIEVKVTMLNINYGNNRKLMDACKPLKEYAWLVDEIRNNQKQDMDLDASVEAAVKAMPDDFVIRPFILANRAEVKTMLMTEYDEELIRKYDRKEGEEIGRKQGEDLFARLVIKLSADGRNEDITKCATNKKLREKLYLEYGLKLKNDE